MDKGLILSWYQRLNINPYLLGYIVSIQEQIIIVISNIKSNQRDTLRL